jgi:LAGLIDADG DNA endonuclease family
MQDNAEGSRSFSRPNLSHWQRSVLVGTLLGDGCLAKHGHWHRLHVKHKLAHRELAEFKRDVFRDFVSMRLHEFDQRLGDRRHPCVQFATRTHPVFTEWHSRFYRERCKVVPEEIDRWMTPLAVAVWFMDDGAVDHWGVTFQTHSFDESEVELLRMVLRERFDLGSNLRKNRQRWILYVPASSMSRFREVVTPFLLSGFEYKMATRALDPVETARRPLFEGEDTVRAHR